MALSSENVALDEPGVGVEELLGKEECFELRIFFQIAPEILSERMEPASAPDRLQDSVEPAGREGELLGNDEMERFFERIVRPEDHRSLLQSKFPVLPDDLGFDEGVEDLVVGADHCESVARGCAGEVVKADLRVHEVVDGVFRRVHEEDFPEIRPDALRDDLLLIFPEKILFPVLRHLGDPALRHAVRALLNLAHHPLLGDRQFPPEIGVFLLKFEDHFLVHAVFIRKSPGLARDFLRFFDDSEGFLVFPNHFRGRTNAHFPPDHHSHFVRKRLKYSEHIAVEIS